MIRLFVLDLDGCVTMPFETPHWPSVTRIRELNQRARTNPKIPQLSICTGRPYPYAEAVAQWLDIQLPLIFESGGGLYDPVRQSVQLSDVYESNKEAILKVRSWAEALVARKFPNALVEFTKMTDAGIIHTDYAIIRAVFNEATTYIREYHPDFEVHHTEVSVNIIHKQANKGTGLQWLSRVTEIPLSETAYIGDSSGDVSALKLVGKPFAPSNASDTVKQVADTMTARTSEGLLQAYEKLIRLNG